MEIGFAGKSLVVTGAGHGFGRAIAHAFCARGAALTRPVGACGTHRPYAKCDVCDGTKDEERAERCMGGQRCEQQDAKDRDKIAECELDPPVGVQ